MRRRSPSPTSSQVSVAILALTPTTDELASLAAELQVEELSFANSPDAATEKLRSDWALVLVDTEFADGSGLATLEGIARSGQPVALMTRAPSLDLTMAAVRKGASDVLSFPPVGARVRELLSRHAEGMPAWPSGAELTGSALIGQSPALLDVFRTVARVAQTETPVLLQGESGTGKESIARVIHDHGPRARGPFVGVSCGAIPEPLLDSELFGHERGVPGVYGRRTGRIERANGGTLFLDEVDALGGVLQNKLLRALRDGEIEPVGSDGARPVTTRVIAASDKDLADDVALGSFREDLFYLLGVMIIHLPPLRQRGGDIILLAQHFLQVFAQTYRKPARSFDADGLLALQSYAWPGNVRQLRNAIERAVVMSDGETITRGDLSPELWTSSVVQVSRTGFPRLDDVERDHITQALQLTKGRLSEAAELLGIHRNTLRRKIEQYGLGSR